MYDIKNKYTGEYLSCLTGTELTNLLAEARATRLAIETQKAQCFGFAERPHLFKKVRRDIARIETELNKIR